MSIDELLSKNVRWYRIATAFVLVILAACHGPAKRPSSVLTDTEVVVPVTDGKVRLKGFIASGSYSERQPEAMTSAQSGCSKTITLIYQTFDQSRIKLSRSDECGVPVNENPFSEYGFLYVYRPEVLYSVDHDDVIVERDGPNIEGEVGPNYSLWRAFESFNKVCFQKIASLKQELGIAMLAATCGNATIRKTMIYSPDHRADVPNLQVSSQIKILMRKGVAPQNPDIISLQATRLFSLPDVAQAIAPVGPNSTEVVISTFAGSVTKVDLKSRKILWQKNLTNPSITSVQETTALNTLAVSLDQKWVAVGGDYGYLAILNGNTGAKIKILSCDPKMFQPFHFQALSFSLDQRSLVTAAVLSETPVSSSAYNQMNFPDSQATYSVKITKWDTEAYSSKWTKEIRAGSILQVGFNQSQNFVIVVASDKVILLSNINGDVIREFPLAHFEGDLAGSFISGGAFSDDMRLLAMSSFSGVTVINSESSKIVKKLRAPLKFELGRPEFISRNNQIRAYDAHGHVFLWDLGSGNLRQVATAPGLSTNYNGPPTMPLLSLAQGQFLVHTQDSPVGIGISIPRAQPSSGHQNICRSGIDADLPDLELRSSASLVVWGPP